MGQPTEKQTHASGWLATVAIAVVILGAAVLFRTFGKSEPEVTANAGDAFLPRTRLLVDQKQNSLSAYNKAMPLPELLAFYNRHTGHPVTESAFETITDSVVTTVLPNLWTQSQKSHDESRFILNHAMATAIQDLYPHRTLTNADVIVFPDAPDLRAVVSEPAGDFFRDSGWHWRWMGKFLDAAGTDGGTSVSKEELKELDIYAAEELSEFLSVFGVAVVELAAQAAPSKTATIDADSVQSVLDKIHKRAHQTAATTTVGSTDDTSNPPQQIAFSEATKRELLSKLPDPMFRDITDQVELDYHHTPNQQNWNRRAALEVPLGIAGGGVSAADYDGDGDMDLYLAGDGGGALLQNVNGKKFQNVTSKIGLATEGETRAGYFADYDNDGDLDLFMTFVGLPNRLFQNVGDGTFEDVTKKANIESDGHITHEAIWFDMNNDGLLDLYTGNFGQWLEGAVPTIGRRNENAPPNRLYLHQIKDGQHVFEEVGQKMGVADRGWTHCVAMLDFDQDGWQDLFTLNDFGASLVYRNLGGKGFKEVSGSLKMDDVYNAMSFTLLDLDHTGNPSIYISQIMKLTHRQRYRKPSEDTQVVFNAEHTENLRVLVTNRLFSQNREGSYRDEHDLRIEPSNLGWAWDVSALDFENDADLDLVVLNGTESNIPANTKWMDNREYVMGRHFLVAYDKEPNVCFIQQDGYFYDVSSRNPIAFAGNSRGSAFFDFDSDGDLDVVLTNYDGKAMLFENLQESDNSWVRFRLEGTQSNRNAVGARVEIHFGDKIRHDVVVSGSGFLSQNPYMLHFGLGQAEKIDKVIIRWPSGVTQNLDNLESRTTHDIKEPAGG